LLFIASNEKILDGSLPLIYNDANAQNNEHLTLNMLTIPPFYTTSVANSFKPIIPNIATSIEEKSFNPPPITLSIAKDVAEMRVFCVWNRNAKHQYEVHQGTLFDCLLGGIENYLWLLAENPEKKGIIHLTDLFHPLLKPWNHSIKNLYAKHFNTHQPITNRYTLTNDTCYYTKVGERTNITLKPATTSAIVPTYHLICTVPPQREKQSHQTLLLEFGTVSAGTWQRHPEFEAHLAKEVQWTLETLKYHKTPTPQQAIIKGLPYRLHLNSLTSWSGKV
jgi:hypothetical protein